MPVFRLDLADPDVRYAAEHDGEEFHTADEDTAYDEARSEWISRERSWKIDPFTKHEVYGRDISPVPRLQAGYAEARRRSQLWTPRRRTSSKVPARSPKT